MIRITTYSALRCSRFKQRAANAAKQCRRAQSSAASSSSAIASSSTLPESIPVASTSQRPPRLGASRLSRIATPQSGATAFEGQHSVAAGSIQEQLAVADICLATGNLLRAKRIFHSVRKAFEEDKGLQYHEGGGDAAAWTARKGTSKMSDVIPASVHTAYLRTHFRQALAYGSANTSGAMTRKRAYVSDAWEWFEMLIKNERSYGRLEDSAWAVMLKGLVA